MRKFNIFLFALLVLPVSLFAAEPHGADTMQAVRYHAYGEPSVYLEEAPRPQPGKGEVLIRVEAAGVNPVDAKVRSGSFQRPGESPKFPLIPGYDVAGAVEAVGEDVTNIRKGEPVYAYLSLKRAGGYAQFAIAQADEVAKRPANISAEKAAAVPLAASTAWEGLVDIAKLGAGQTILIHGGSGGVGAFAVQIAKARGARVLATASTSNQDLLKQLGVDQPIDYTKAKFEEVAKDVDVVFDMVGGETLARSYAVVRKGGIIVSIVQPPDEKELAKRAIRGQVFLVKPSGQVLDEITKLIEAGKITPIVSQTFPLAEAAAAHRAIETGHTRGKIVLRVSEEK